MEWWQLIGSGFLTALVTGWLLGPHKAVALPGGSLGLGAVLWWGYGVGIALSGAVLGLLGWVAYCLLVQAVVRLHRGY